MIVNRHLFITLVILMASACQTAQVKRQSGAPLPINSIDLGRINHELSIGERISEYVLSSSSGVEFNYHLTANSYGDARFVIFINGKDSNQTSVHFWFDNSCGMNQNAKIKIRNGRRIETVYFDGFTTHLLPTNVSLAYRGESQGHFQYIFAMGGVEKKLVLKNKVESIALEVFNGAVMLNGISETM